MVADDSDNVRGGDRRDVMQEMIKGVDRWWDRRKTNTGVRFSNMNLIVITR